MDCNNSGTHLGNELEQWRHCRGLWRYVVDTWDRWQGIDENHSEIKKTLWGKGVNGNGRQLKQQKSSWFLNNPKIQNSCGFRCEPEIQMFWMYKWSRNPKIFWIHNAPTIQNIESTTSYFFKQKTLPTCSTLLEMTPQNQHTKYTMDITTSMDNHGRHLDAKQLFMSIHIPAYHGTQE